MSIAPALALTMKRKTIRDVASLSERYCRENLSSPYFQKDSLERDWWNGLRLFLNHSFFQGRRDEVSEKVEVAAMPVLNRYFEGHDANLLTHMDYRGLETDLGAVIGKGKVGKARDIKMLVSIFEFIAALSEKNLTLYSVRKVQQGNLADHYRELQGIRQIGPKITSFYLRDLVCIYELDGFVQQNDLEYLQPVDVWVKKVAQRLGIIPVDKCSDGEARSRIIEMCRQCDVSPLKFNQGAWYLGKNAFEILICQLDKIDLSF